MYRTPVSLFQAFSPFSPFSSPSEKSCLIMMSHIPSSRPHVPGAVHTHPSLVIGHCLPSKMSTQQMAFQIDRIESVLMAPFKSWIRRVSLPLPTSLICTSSSLESGWSNCIHQLFRYQVGTLRVPSVPSENFFVCDGAAERKLGERASSRQRSLGSGDVGRETMIVNFSRWEWEQKWPKIRRGWVF